MQAISAWWWEAAGFIEHGVYPEEIAAGTGAAGITGGGNHDRSTVFAPCLSIIWPGLWWDHVCLADVANMWQQGPIGFLLFLWVAHGLPCLDHNFQDAVGPWERCRSHTHFLCAVFLGFSAWGRMGLELEQGWRVQVLRSSAKLLEMCVRLYEYVLRLYCVFTEHIWPRFCKCNVVKFPSKHEKDSSKQMQLKHANRRCLMSSSQDVLLQSWESIEI